MSIRNLSVDFAFYGLLDLLQRSVGLIMLPLYTRVLSQPEYGDLDIMLIVNSMLFVLVDLQLVSGFSRLYLEYYRSGRGPRFVGTILVTRLVIGLAIPGFCVLAGHLGLLEFSFLPSFAAHAVAWTLTFMMVPVTLIYEILVLQARMLRRKRAFAAGELANTVISCAGSVVFVTVWQLGIAGVVLGLMLGRLIGLLPPLWALRREIELCLEGPTLRELGRYTLPLVPGRWVGQVSSYLGRFFVYGVRGADQDAILAVCMKISNMIGLYSVSFRSAWEPLAMSYVGEAGGEQFYVRSMRLFAAGGLGCILFLSACLQPLLIVLTPGTYGAVAGYFPIFAVGVLLGECDANLQLGNQIARTTYWISISSLVYLIVNLGILVTLTHSLGIFAVGLGLAVATVAKGTVTYLSAQRNHPIAYDGRAFAWLGVGCAGLLVLGAALHAGLINEWMFSAGAAALGLSVPWIMLAPIERHRIGGIVTARLARAGAR